MRTFVIALVALALLCTLAASVVADETFEVVADSTINGNDGFLLRITEPGEGGTTLFLFEEVGKIRAYAEREFGSAVWDIFSGAQYVCPATSMSLNDSWRALDDEGEETVANVVAQESITTGAGTFTCFKVDIARASNPNTITENLWFSSGTGLVRQYDTFPDDWQSDLQNVIITGGSGFFPLAVGNTWDYSEISTPLETSSWGAVKVDFGD